MHDDSCDHQNDDEPTAQLLCHLLCAGTAAIAERLPQPPTPAPQQYLASLDIAVSSLATPPDPYPPRHDI